MKTCVTLLAILIAGTLVWSGTAIGQTTAKQGCEAMKAGAPQKVEGQIVNVDPNQAKVTIKGSDGKTHEFQASQETIRDFKVGDRIEAQLRGATNC
jgi:ribosomal protein S1